MISVMIVEDLSILRESIRFILEHDDEIEVCGLAQNGREAFEMCKVKKPQVILMDILMPEFDGVEATRMIKEAFPGIRIIILTTFKDDENITKALKYGADGYILKDVDPLDLPGIIKNVHKGISVIQRDVLTQIYTGVVEVKETTRYDRYDLTEKEIQAVRLLVDGKNYREISASLYMTEGSVRNLISDILKKLQLKDRIQLAVFAVKNKII